MSPFSRLARLEGQIEEQTYKSTALSYLFDKVEGEEISKR